MVSRPQDFQELTTVLYSDVDMSGMLRKVPTRQFGSSTLLKLLLSIKAKPTQAALAGETALAHETSMDSTDSMAGGDTDNEEGFTTVKKCPIGARGKRPWGLRRNQLPRSNRSWELMQVSFSRIN